ncbi:MAG: HlyC/CorC family transporter [Caldilineaceae bacterium]|nr:HlyC/CorC family transporter [Caldilineaceae bacterium]
MESELFAWIMLAAAAVVVALAAAAEIALAAVDRSEIRRMIEAGHSRAVLVNSLLSEASQFWLAASLTRGIGKLVIGVALVFVAGSSWPVLLVTILAAWLVLTAVQLGIRALVLRGPTAIAMALAPVIKGIIIVLAPLTFMLHRAGLRMSGEDVADSDESIFMTEDGLRLLMQVSEEESTMQESEKQMIASILEMDETVAREVMVPRIDMVALEVNTDLQAALNVIIEAGHSRIPIYEGNVDVILGLLYAKDLLKCFRDNQTDVPIRELLRPAYFVPASKRVDLLLKELRQQRIHLAMVVDEYGGIAGLVTVEDIIEEIVGDIQDEYDIHEEAYYQAIGEQTYLINSRLDIDSLADLLDTELPDEDADTVGGLIYSRLGHVPEQGESVDVEGWRFTVLSVEGRRINQVRAERINEPANVEEASQANASRTRKQNSVLNPSSMANQ